MTSEPVHLLGIDFSGSAAQWRPGCRRPNVWVSSATLVEGGISVRWITPIQQLTGNADPFERLSRFLSGPERVYAAIDAPFGLPVSVVPESARETRR